MMSPEIQTKNYLQKELSSSYENMIKQKMEIIRNEIVTCPFIKDEKIYSVGLGFALTEKNLDSSELRNNNSLI
jgi:hypothetical protein